MDDLTLSSRAVLAFPTLITAAAMVCLGLVVLLRERGTWVSALFALMAFISAGWLAAFSRMYSAPTAAEALRWATIGYLAVPMLPVSVYHFTVTLLGFYSRTKWVVWAGWLAAGGFAIASATTHALISGVTRYRWGYYPRYDWLSLPYLIFFIGLLMAAARYLMIDYRQAAPETIHRYRVRALLIAFGIAYLGLVDFLPKFGVPIYPAGYAAILGFLLIVARAIWRYHLVDLTPAFAAKQIIKTIADPLLVLDQAGVIRVVNRAASQLLQRPPRQLVGRALAELRGELLPPEVFAALIRQGGTQRYEVGWSDAGMDVGLEVTASVFQDRSAQPAGVVVIAKDIARRQQMERELKALNETLEQRVDVATRELRAANARLERLSFMDPLTELFNRRGLQQALAQELRWSRRDGRVILALLLDMDNFKQINDAFGYAVGDVVLKEIARQLRGALRATDHVARIGGDEFMALLPQTRLAEGALVAEKLRVRISETPILIAGSRTVHVTASAGLITVRPDTPSLNELLADVHLALARSKHTGKNRVSLEAMEFAQEAEGRLNLSRVLDALRAGDSFRVVAQPILRLNDRHTVGFELLSRLALPAFALPEDFFRLAIEANLLTLVDHHCFQACLRGAMALPADTLCHLNLFPSTLMNVPTSELLAARPSEANTPHRLCVELSEQQLIGEPSYLCPAVNALKRAGVLIAVDDVGFGHSSLESLIVLEPHIIKVDKRCVAGIARDALRARALQRLVRLARTLETRVVAEGIELPEDLRRLQELGVHYGQGFLLGKPLPTTMDVLPPTDNAIMRT